MTLEELKSESNRLNNKIIGLFEEIDRLESDKVFIDEQIDAQSKKGVL